ncbi:HalOD1 output domain-containing protein [Halosimplex amylolyticum]|uniref:HalOD1 output domain-containing protein n=1 Tax=Halosimplex amylolyticum TaxID=3396616 RepID=UPI003F56A554
MNDAPSTPTAARPYDEPRSASETVVEAVAEAANVSPLDLDPLARTLDPDALDSFVARLSKGSGGSVEFVYNGYDVTVSSDGTVDVYEK